ncbi:hypothetical protein [Pseudomonas phage vB_PseuGesM_254]|uniref:Uncharacterized protein n=1 Tax=Pseudomonas phage vB_PseuGesM_254 TaxID=3092638 RepID=A0AAX4G7C9_9CAUD|nr:hypothetical protein [Pseudomonas phage PseuGes_254]
MNNIELNIAGVDVTFAVDINHDSEHGAPWDECEGHGPVTGWLSRDKRPDELVLNTDVGRKRFYNFKEACAIALRDGWGCDALDGTETKRQKAAKAARADFEYLRSWCNDEWSYVGVEVTLLDSEGNKTEVSDSVWGVEGTDDQIRYTAENLADDLAHGLHTRFEVVTTEVQSFKLI